MYVSLTQKPIPASIYITQFQNGGHYNEIPSNMSLILRVIQFIVTAHLLHCYISTTRSNTIYLRFITNTLLNEYRSIQDREMLKFSQSETRSRGMRITDDNFQSQDERVWGRNQSSSGSQMSRVHLLGWTQPLAIKALLSRSLR